MFFDLVTARASVARIHEDSSLGCQPLVVKQKLKVIVTLDLYKTS